MALTGKLRTWHDDRGFGFIAPTGGGRELFVHISAFPRDGSRPTVGETLDYELGTGKDGKPQAVRVVRKAWESSAAPLANAGARTEGSRSLIVVIVVIVVLAVCAGIAFHGFKQLRTPSQAQKPQSVQSVPQRMQPAAASAFRCDGRTHCSQMTSCAEAKYFLANCPGTTMDGNNDGVPCEQQWCTSPFAK